MTITDTYHTTMVAPPEQSPHTSICDKLMQSAYAQAMAAVADITDEEMARANAVFPRLIEVTEQEEEAWIEKLKQLAGCVA